MASYNVFYEKRANAFIILGQIADKLTAAQLNEDYARVGNYSEIELALESIADYSKSIGLEVSMDQLWVSPTFKIHEQTSYPDNYDFAAHEEDFCQADADRICLEAYLEEIGFKPRREGAVYDYSFDRNMMVLGYLFRTEGLEKERREAGLYDD